MERSWGRREILRRQAIKIFKQPSKVEMRIHGNKKNYSWVEG